MKGRIDAFLPPKEEPKQDDKDAAAAEAASEEKATDGEPDDGQKAKKKQDKKEADGQEDKGQGEDEEDEDEPGEEEEEVPKHEEDEDEDEEEAEEEEVEEEEEEEVEEEEVEEEEVEEEEEAEVDDEAEEDEEEDDDEEAAVDDKEEHGSAEESLVGGEHEEEGPQLFYAIENCQGEGEEELSFQKGDVLTIVDRGRGVKDWWRARDKAGNVGWVPSTHLKKCPPTSTRDRWRKAFKKVSGRRQTVRGFTPSTLVLPSCHGQAVSFYRKELSLGLRGQGRFCSEQMFSPFVATFPQAVSQCDLMDVLMEEWSKLQASREFRSQKRTDDEVRRRFIALFADVVYPTLQVHNLPPYSLLGDNTRRSQVLLKHRARLATGSGHALLLDADLRFRPIDVHQFALDLLGPLR